MRNLSLALAPLVLLVSCGGDKGTAPISVDSVSMSVATTALQYGQSVQLAAIVRGSNGQTLTDRTVTWASSSDAIAAVSPSGLVTAGAVRAGTAESVTITATAGGKSATTIIAVAPIPVSSVAMSLTQAAPYVGQATQLSATLRDATGASVTGRTITWVSSASGVATVSAQGLVTAVAAGSAVVSANAEGVIGSATITVRPAPFMQAAVRGNGKIAVLSLRSGRADTVADSRAVAIQLGDSLRVTPIAGAGALFDGIAGAVTDSLQLMPYYDVKVIDYASLEVRFVPRNSGMKALQNAFFDTTSLDYRTSQNFVVWWDKRWDHNYLAKDVLRQLEAVRVKADAWGMRTPPGSDRVYLNAYLHHKSGEGGPNLDVFDDGWGQGVGTDSYHMPFYTAPLGQYRNTIADTFCWCNGDPWHEGFHLHQWAAGNVPPLVFAYGGDNAWYTEASADFVEKYFTLSAANSALGFGTFHGTPAFLMQPQLRLWSPPGSPLWSVGVHAYAAHLFLLYLTWNGLVAEDFVGRSFASGTSLSPQEYLSRNIPNFRDVYRRFATQIVVLDGIPDWARRNIADAITYWRTNGAQAGNALPNGQNADNTYAFDLKDSGTAGWVTPSALLESWAFSVTRLKVTQANSYRIAINAARVGSEQTQANLYVGLVFEQNGVIRYSEIPLTDFQGTIDTAVAANTRVYVVVVSTPNRFTGAETFPYSIKVDKLP